MRMVASDLSEVEYQHQLMTLLTVAGLNVALIKRRLLEQVPFDHEVAFQSLQRVEAAHRSIALLHARAKDQRHS